MRIVCFYIEDFNEWLESDNVVHTMDDNYITQCTGFRKTFTLEELKEYFGAEYGEEYQYVG